MGESVAYAGQKAEMEDVQPLPKEAVSIAYKVILGREPESEASIVAHQAEPSLDQLGRRLLASAEFRHRMATDIAAPSTQKWVCTELRHGLKLWVDLYDLGVSAGCLQDNWEPAETDFILSVLAPGDVFVDVGANIGWFTILAAHAVGPEGQVHSFEPREDRYRRLVQSVAENGFEARCQIAQVALGTSESEADLAWVPGEQNPGHSFILPEALPAAAERLGRVPVRPLDSCGITRRVRVMKIDVEGAEPHVLAGACGIVARDQPILVIEVFPRWLSVVGGTTAAALLDGLRDIGYRVFRLAETGLGRELRAGEDGSEPSGPEYFTVIALSDEDCGRLLAQRLDQRVADLERRVALADEAWRAAEARAAAAEAAMAETTRAAEARAAAAEAAMAETTHAAEARAAAAEAAMAETTHAAEARAAAAEAAMAETTRAAEASSRELHALRAELAASTACLRAIEASTLWRAADPLRSLGSHVPVGARRTIRRILRLGWWTMTLQLPRRLRAYLATRAAEPGNATAAAAGATPAPVSAAAAAGATPAPVSAAPAASATPGSPWVVPPTAGSGPPPRLPARKLPRALVIDSTWPRPDRDSGSLDAFLQACALRDLGYEVVFAGDADFAEASPYLARLEAEGILCLSPALCPSIEAFLHSDGARLDLCILSRVYSGGRYLEAVREHAPRAQVIFNTVDLHHIREEREARLRGETAALRRAEATRERELYLVRQADATVVVSATELALLEATVPGAAIFEMPLARPIRDRGRIPGFGARWGVGFVGGFAHQPNIDAAGFLLQEVWPRVRDRLPAAQLSLVGADLPATMLVNAPPGVRYLGPLPDLDPWLDGLRLTVAPLRYGAGVKGKVASSLAAGVPCVGTPIAAEGMRLRDGVEILVGDTAEALAARICEVHEDQVLWSLLSGAGHDKALHDLSVEAGERRLAALLHALGLPASRGAAMALAS